jgi:SAM-dependent methyltransferase
MLVLLHDKLSHVPFTDDPARVIDLGTGTGAWAIDFADAHPGSHVIGNDFSPIQPAFVPPNVEFIVDDFEDEWNYESNPFDFVFGRYLGGSVRNWPKLMKQAYNNLKPGGWVEFQDWDCMIDSQDGSVKPESALWRWSQLCTDRIGKIASLRPGPDLEGWVRGAGFENVVVQKVRIPLGTWPKDEHHVSAESSWTMLRWSLQTLNLTSCCLCCVLD